MCIVVAGSTPSLHDIAALTEAYPVAYNEFDAQDRAATQGGAKVEFPSRQRAFGKRYEWIVLNALEGSNPHLV